LVPSENALPMVPASLFAQKSWFPSSSMLGPQGSEIPVMNE
jgi:hypothetical protein